MSFISILSMIMIILQGMKNVGIVHLKRRIERLKIQREVGVEVSQHVIVGVGVGQVRAVVVI